MKTWVIRSIITGECVILDQRGYVAAWTSKPANVNSIIDGNCLFTEASAKYLAIMLQASIISGLPRFPRHEFVAEQI